MNGTAGVQPTEYVAAPTYGATLLEALRGHSAQAADDAERSAALSVSVARALGCDADEAQDAHLVALYHDVGKLHIASHTLHRPALLKAHEYDELRSLPQLSSQLVSGDPDLYHLAPAVRAVRERYDGTGLPDGLVGEEIPLISRIVSVTTTFVSLTSHRSYRPASRHGLALFEIARHDGTQFCPECVGALNYACQPRAWSPEGPHIPFQLGYDSLSALLGSDIRPPWGAG